MTAKLILPQSDLTAKQSRAQIALDLIRGKRDAMPTAVQSAQFPVVYEIDPAEAAEDDNFTPWFLRSTREDNLALLRQMDRNAGGGK